MGQARFQMSLELFTDLMTLPDGASIVEVEMAPHTLGPTMYVYVEHPDLIDGEQVSPVFRRYTQSAVVFENWGKPKQPGGIADV